MGTIRNLDAGSARVDLRGLKEGTHPLVLGGDTAVLPVDPEKSVVLDGFRFEGSLVWTPEDRRVRGSLHGSLAVVCDRCLSRFQCDVSVELDVPVRIAVESPAREGGEDAAGGEEDFIRVAPVNPELDLAEVFRAAALLEVPIKRVCREDCRGLCPQCGANRNEESCECATERRDPRWDALRGLTSGPDPQE